MAYKLIIQVEAILEIQDAFNWYEEQRDGLGYELLKEIDSSYKNITEYPERYSYFNDLYRCIKTNRFPYLIIFEIEGNNVVVNGVRHIRRERR